MAFLGLILWLPVAAVLSGASLKVWWGWFIAAPGGPFNLPHLTTFQAIGVSLVVSYMTLHTTPDDDDRDADVIVVETVVKGIIMLAFFWVLAIVVHAVGS